MSFPLSEYTKINVSWGLAPDPTGGAYSASPDLLAGFKGVTSWQEGNAGEVRTRWRGEGEGEWGREGKRGSWGNSALVVGRIDATAGHKRNTV